MSWTLFLDDLRDPPTGSSFQLARSVLEAWAIIERQGAPSLVAFDHDLGDGEPTGLAFAKGLVERDLDQGGLFLPPGFAFSIHSDNRPGSENIHGLLASYLDQREPALPTRRLPQFR